MEICPTHLQSMSSVIMGPVGHPVSGKSHPWSVCTRGPSWECFNASARRSGFDWKLNAIWSSAYSYWNTWFSVWEREFSQKTNPNCYCSPSDAEAVELNSDHSCWAWALSSWSRFVCLLIVSIPSRDPCLVPSPSYSASKDSNSIIDGGLQFSVCGGWANRWAPCWWRVGVFSHNREWVRVVVGSCSCSSSRCCWRWCVIVWWPSCWFWFVGACWSWGSEGGQGQFSSEPKTRHLGYYGAFIR